MMPTVVAARALKLATAANEIARNLSPQALPPIALEDSITEARGLTGALLLRGLYERIERGNVGLQNLVSALLPGPENTLPTFERLATLNKIFNRGNEYFTLKLANNYTVGLARSLTDAELEAVYRISQDSNRISVMGGFDAFVLEAPKHLSRFVNDGSIEFEPLLKALKAVAEDSDHNWRFSIELESGAKMVARFPRKERKQFFEDAQANPILVLGTFGILSSKFQSEYGSRPNFGVWRQLCASVKQTDTEPEDLATGLGFLLGSKSFRRTRDAVSSALRCITHFPWGSDPDSSDRTKRIKKVAEVVSARELRGFLLEAEATKSDKRAFEVIDHLLPNIKDALGRKLRRYDFVEIIEPLLGVTDVVEAGRCMSTLIRRFPEPESGATKSGHAQLARDLADAFTENVGTELGGTRTGALAFESRPNRRELSEMIAGLNRFTRLPTYPRRIVLWYGAGALPEVLGQNLTMPNLKEALNHLERLGNLVDYNSAFDFIGSLRELSAQHGHFTVNDLETVITHFIEAYNKLPKKESKTG